MKRYYFCKARTSLLKSVLVLFVMMAAVAAKAQDASTTYNFKSLPTIDSLLFAGDATNWTLVTDGNNKYFTNATAMGKYHGEKNADADLADYQKYFFKLNINGSEPQSYAGLWWAAVRPCTPVWWARPPSRRWRGCLQRWISPASSATATPF